MRKGLLFSFILVSLTLTLVSLLTVHRGMISFYGEKLAVETRVNSMKNFYESIITDGHKALDIISQRAVSAATSYVITKGKGLEQADVTIEELILNGTINQTLEPLMEDTTFPDWINKMEELGSLGGFSTNIGIQSLEVKPYDSWNLLVTTEISVSIIDQQGIANLKRNASINQLVSVEGFEDPLYPLNTQGWGTNVITKSPYQNNFTQNLITSSGGNGWGYGKSIILLDPTLAQGQAIENISSKVLITNTIKDIKSFINNFKAVVCECDIDNVFIPYVDHASISPSPNNTDILVDGDNGKVWYIENLKNDAANSYYHPSLKGASFLDRLEGKLNVQDKYQNQTSKIIGLESFVNKDYFATFFIPADIEKTNIDYLYFSDNYYAAYGVKGTNVKFRIDNELSTDNKPHSIIYGISEILI